MTRLLCRRPGFLRRSCLYYLSISGREMRQRRGVDCLERHAMCVIRRQGSERSRDDSDVVLTKI
jgi:hypothetical protein